MIMEMEEIKMKIKIWCEKYFLNSFILGNTNKDGVTIYNEKIIAIISKL